MKEMKDFYTLFIKNHTTFSLILLQDSSFYWDEVSLFKNVHHVHFSSRITGISFNQSE